jgi:hypothetical protein
MKYTSPQIQQEIEAYLRQEMTDLERSGFERRMHEDSELHEEVKHQESLIQAIRRERVMELKAGLQAVPVSLWSAALFEYAKIAAITAGIGLASLGTYLYLNRNQDSAPDNNQKVEVSIQNPPALRESETQQKIQPETAPQLAQSENQKENTIPETNKIKSESAKNTIQPENALLTSPVQHDSELSEPQLKHSQPETPRDLNLPEDGLSNKTYPESMQPEVVIKKDNREKFHYQFSEGKLVLYADFNEKLYEVLELNQHGQQSLFLSYDGKFYALNPLVSEISPLQEVKDKNLIQILSVYQKRK